MFSLSLKLVLSHQWKVWMWVHVHVHVCEKGKIACPPAQGFITWYRLNSLYQKWLGKTVSVFRVFHRPYRLSIPSPQIWNLKCSKIQHFFDSPAYFWRSFDFEAGCSDAPVIQITQRLKLEDPTFQTSCGNLATPWLKIKGRKGWRCSSGLECPRLYPQYCQKKVLIWEHFGVLTFGLMVLNLY